MLPPTEQHEENVIFLYNISRVAGTRSSAVMDR